MDPDKTSLLLSEHHQAAFSWACACCGDPAHAADALQSAYLKILQGKARFEERSSFKTWLFGVIRWTAAQQRRRRIFEQILFAPIESAAETGAHDPPPSDSESDSARCRAAMQRLSSRQRELLHLVFFEEMTIEEAARVAGVSLGSARTHYERGKRRLKKILEENETAEEQSLRTGASRLVA